MNTQPSTKICYKCHLEKPFAEFHKNGDNPDGLYSYCKQCVKDWQKSPKGREASRRGHLKYRSNPASLAKEHSAKRLSRKLHKYKPDPNLIEKTCCTCQQLKTIKRFSLDCCNKDGYAYQCKDCQNKIKRHPLSKKQRFIHNLRNRQKRAVEGKLKNGPTEDFLGCSASHAIERLEYQWERDFPGFDKTDRHIDHIRPIKKFPNLLNDSEQRKICFNYNNLQYLPKTENLKKHDKYNPSDFENAWIADNGYTWRLCDDKRYKLTNLGY